MMRVQCKQLPHYFGRLVHALDLLKFGPIEQDVAKEQVVKLGLDRTYT